MNFDNRIKGAVTQTLLKSLLEDAGYAVIPMGIEESVREIKLLGKTEYQQFNFAGTQRSTPDFLVLDWDKKQNWLIEVKYRRKWDDEVRDALTEVLEKQVGRWGEIFVVFFIGEAVEVSNKRNPDFLHVGVANLVMHNGELIVDHGISYIENMAITFPQFVKWSECGWKDFTFLYKAFNRLIKKDDRVLKCIKIAQCLSEKLA